MKTNHRAQGSTYPKVAIVILLNETSPWMSSNWRSLGRNSRQNPKAPNRVTSLNQLADGLRVEGGNHVDSTDPKYLADVPLAKKRM